MNKITVLIIFFITSFSKSQAQQSIKLRKQQTTFFYTQLNLHGGYLNDKNGERWDVTDSGPNNQLAFQLLKKDKGNLQRGYVKTLSPVEFSLRFSVLFDKKMNETGEQDAYLRLKLRDTWVKFQTKWDRTSIWIGNKSIPYGHNPKLDPVSSFMVNLIKMDLGFTQDVGLFIKTPINRNLDLELSITSGGLLNNEGLVYNNLMDKAVQDEHSTFSFGDFSYNNTWLLTSRIGNQSFNKNEFGLIAVSGRVANNLVENDFVTINRIGIDWIHKYREKIKFGNQFTFGCTTSEVEKSFITMNYQGSADFYLNDRIILSSAMACNFHNSINSDRYHFNLTNTNSITYAVSPHTRFRINHYYKKIFKSDQVKWGVFLQFVTGIGKHN